MNNERVIVEEEINTILKKYQEATRIDSKNEISIYGNQLLNYLTDSVPLQFKSIIVIFSLPSGERAEDITTDMEGYLGRQPKNPCAIEVSTPRRANIPDEYSTHGSAMRERLVGIGEIRTIERGNLYDLKNSPCHTKEGLIINPVWIGVPPMRTVGVYYLSPIEIKKIKISERVPAYLNTREKTYVKRWPNL